MGAGASAEPRPRPQPRIIRLGQGNHGNFILLDGRARAQPQMIIHRNGTLVANNGTTNGLSLQPGSSLAILAALAASELRLQAALERTEAALSSCRAIKLECWEELCEIEIRAARGREREALWKEGLVK